MPQCLQLSLADLASLIAAGAVLVGGPYPTSSSCVANCGQSSSSLGPSASPSPVSHSPLSSSPSAGSTGPSVTTPCCDFPVPLTLYATATGGTCDGTKTIVNDGSGGGFVWKVTGSMGSCGNIIPVQIYLLACNTSTNQWNLNYDGDITIYTPDSVVCKPFHLTFLHVNMVFCGCGADVRVDITQ